MPDQIIEDTHASDRPIERREEPFGDRRSRRWTHLFLFAAIMLVTFVLKGYQFGAADNCGMLPIHFRMFDPAYLPNDWYVNQNTDFSIRHIYGLLTGLPAKIIGWPAAYFIVHILSWFLIFDGIVRITETVTGRRRLGYLAAAFVIAISHNHPLGKEIWASIPIPRDLARGFAMMGLWAWLSDRWILGGAFLGAAMSVHIFVGGEPLGIFAVAIVAQAIVSRRFTRAFVRGFGGGLVASAIVGAPALFLLAKSMLFSAEEAQTDIELAAQIAGFVRDAQNVVLREIPFMQYFTAAIDLAIIAFAWTRWRPTDNGPTTTAWQRLGWVLATTVCLMLISVVFTDIARIPLAITMTPLMNSFWVRVGSAVAVAVILEGAIRSRRAELVVASEISIPLIVAVAFLDVHTLFARVEWIGAIGLVALLVALVTQAAWWRIVVRYSRAAAIATVTIIAAAFVGSYLLRQHPPAAGSFRYHLWRNYTYTFSFGYPPLTPGDEELARWVRAETPRDAVFLTPPIAEWFRLRTERAVILDWKAIPYKPTATIAWFERLQALTGDTTSAYRWNSGEDSRSRITTQYNELPQEAAIRAARRYHAGYIVRARKSVPLALPLAYEGRTYRVYAVPAPVRAATEATPQSPIRGHSQARTSGFSPAPG